MQNSAYYVPGMSGSEKYTHTKADRTDKVLQKSRYRCFAGIKLLA